MGSDTIAEINFFSHTIDGSAPWMDSNPKLGWTTTNYAQTPQQVTIHDLRGKENRVDLDINGFEILKYDGNVLNVFDDNSETQRCYYEEIVDVLKKRLNASHVIIFNHITRSRGPSRSVDQCDSTHKNPIFYPHVDNDPSGAYFKLKEIVGEEESKKIMQNRFQIINVWRPLGSHPIRKIPLAICDYRSLDLNNDIHVSEVRGTVATVSIYTISHNSQNTQKWYYLSEMRSNEMFIFKIFDSKSDVAQFGAHTAFINENVPSTLIEQDSIEMRCLILYSSD
ncbi:unnamed protein product [Adineta ricciae]|uniref:Uncharacterized protein n=1 Tax=Adineta ricciae TaxID=249248 RepID=A0A816EL78_ADIRI|nr:unnamed protein product [Adineta ricciae]CAF1651177.1 unnamed protein product [Adineta ricciae]